MNAATSLALPFYGENIGQEFFPSDKRPLWMILYDMSDRPQVTFLDHRLLWDMWDTSWKVQRPCPTFTAAFTPLEGMVTNQSLEPRIKKEGLLPATFRDLVLICDHHLDLLKCHTYFPTGTIKTLEGVSYIPSIRKEDAGISILLQQLPYQCSGEERFLGKQLSKK